MSRGPSIAIDMTDFAVATMTMTPIELGQRISRMMHDVVDGLPLQPWTRSFIRRRFIGTSKRPTIPPSVKRRVLAIGSCSLCGSSEQLQVDHVIAVVDGGTDDEANLQPLCRPCNRRKGPQAWARKRRGY